jgi:hypothetical protein
MIPPANRTPTSSADNAPTPPDAPARVQAAADAPTTPNPKALLSLLLWEVGPPLAAYYALRLLGYGSYPALLAGAATAGLRLLYLALRKRKFDGFAAFLMTLFGVGVLLTFVTGDERFLVAKDSLNTGLAGLIFLGSCLARRPLTFTVVKRLAGRDQDRLASLTAKWGDSPPFRRAIYVTSIGWGVGLLIDAAIRVPLVYLLPIDVAVGVSKLMHIATFGVLIIWTAWYGRRVERHGGRHAVEATVGELR